MYLLYFIVWIIFAGSINLEVCAFGIVIASVIFAFTCKFMDYSIEKEKRALKKSFQFLVYVIVLLKEIMVANYQTVKMILSEKEEIKPVLVDFQPDIKGEIGKVLLANSITLTPGTITVNLDESGYLVHCLDESLADGMEDSVFVELLKKMEEK